MRWLTKTSLRYRYLVVFLAAVMTVLAVNQVLAMPVDVFPEFAPPIVEIQTEAWGMSAAEVEDLVTIQLEEALVSTPGLDVMRSKSVPGLSSVKLLFKSGADYMEARQMVQERLAVAIPSLPTTIGQPWILQPLSSTSRCMKVGLSSEKYDLMELSMIAYWTITYRLMQVPGVANVAIWGERWQMLTVQADQERMRAYDVSLDELMEVTSEALEYGLLKYTPHAKTMAGGWIDTPNQRLTVQHVTSGITPEELAHVTVYDRLKHDGTPLRLEDVSDVAWVHQPLIGDAVINDGPGLLFIVEKFPWGNTLQVTRGVEEALDELRPGLEGIEIDSTIFRPATFVEVAMENLGSALLFSALLVIVVLFAFLWEWRVALISVLIIPFAILAALLILNTQDATLNVMVLAAMVIAIDAIIDDAVVGVENTMRRLRQLRSEGRPVTLETVVLEGALEVSDTIVYGSLSQVVALVPLFFMQGLSGAFFRPLAGAYVLVCLISPLIALTVTPAMVLIFLKNAPAEHRESPLARWLKRGYTTALTWSLRRPAWAYGVVAVLVISGLVILPFFGQELLPDFKETDFLMHWLGKPGMSHPEMYRITVQASKELRAIPGVRNFGAHIGRAVAADEVVGMYFTENWVSIDPKVDYDATLAAIQETVDGYPGLVRDVQTYLKERIREVLTGSSEAIVLRIYGPELEVLRSKAEEVRQVLAGIDGIVDLHVELHVDIAQIQVTVDLAKAELYGIKPGDVRRAAATLVSGTEVSDIHKDNYVYEVQMWSTPQTRASLTSIREMLIDTPLGGKVPLGDLADVRIISTPNVIQRENQSRRIEVEANARGRDLGSVVRDVERGLEQVEWPLEYHAELLGEYAERQVAQRNLLVAAIVAVIAIFFLLNTSFGNWRLTILAFVTLPQAVFGGLLAVFFIGGRTLSLGSLVGLLTVLDNAVRNCIMLFTHYQHLEREEGVPFGLDLILRGSVERITPMAMLGLTAGVALVPLLLAGNIPGNEIQYPMAIVILGGLFTSEVLNLFVVPMLYLHFGKSRRERDALEAAATASA
jgi:CzcA family heavy metal efflux pump